MGSFTVLLALLTANFEESVWTNQETGYILGRMEKAVPLIVGKTDIKKFEFSEALRGIPTKEKSPEQSFEEILSTITARTLVTTKFVMEINNTMRARP